METKNKILKRLTRKKRIRKNVHGSSLRPRLSIFRSNKHIYAQIIDDSKGKTLVAVSEKDLGKLKTKLVKTQIASLIGEMLAKKALKKKIKKVVFDRSGYKYHGRVKALAEGARKGGLEF